LVSRLLFIDGSKIRALVAVVYSICSCCSHQMSTFLWTSMCLILKPIRSMYLM
jgi:hypothetical protein